MTKSVFMVALALALTACGHTAPVAQVGAPAAFAVASAAEKAEAAKLVEAKLVPPGEGVRMQVLELALKAGKKGTYSFTCTRTETTRYAERNYYAVKGTVDVTTGKVEYTEQLVKTEPLG
jgi:hypothetical protein